MSKQNEVVGTLGCNPKSLPQVKSLGIYINDCCNLKCKYCYYKRENSSKDDLSTDQLISILDSALQSNVRLFTLVGKEIFLPKDQEKTLKIIEFLFKRKMEGAKIRIGAVTNGTFLHEVIPHLKNTPLDFLDISIDSPIEGKNDAFRGKDTFNRTIQNLRSAVENKIAKKVFISSTILKDNLSNILDVWDLESIGVKHYSMMPVLPVKDEAQALSYADLHRILTVDIPNKARTLKSNIEVIFDLDSCIVGEDIKFFSKFFKGDTIKIDSANQKVITKKIGKLNLIFRIELPDPCNSHASIGHDGFFFDKGGCMIMKEGREKHALCKVTARNFKDLIILQEKKATNIFKNNSDLFFTPAKNLLNELENTDFYNLPKMIKGN